MSCTVCLSPKANLECGICKEPVCKTCAQFLEDDSFSFLQKVPEELACSAYCSRCFDEKVAPQLAEYEATMEKARKVTVFLKNQSKESRIYKSLEAPITVDGCPDAKEALLRLAFFAVQANFNGLINVDISAKKFREGGYQNSIYSGIGTPTHIQNENSLRK